MSLSADLPVGISYAAISPNLQILQGGKIPVNRDPMLKPVAKWIRNIN